MITILVLVRYFSKDVLFSKNTTNLYLCIYIYIRASLYPCLYFTEMTRNDWTKPSIAISSLNLVGYPIHCIGEIINI